MADRNKFEQLLEYIVNNEQEKAEALFHSLVVEKSREIYEGLFEDEMADVDLDEAKDEEDEEEKMDEASRDEEDEEDEKMDESFDDVEEAFDSIEEIGGDPADDMMSDVEAGSDEDEEEGEEEGEGEGDLEDRVMDLEDALDDLKAEFEKLMGDEGDDMGADMDMDMGADDEKKEMFAPAFEEEIEEIDLSPAEQMREYVEKVGEAYKGGKVAASSEAGGANTKSIVAKKNDMGGTTANIAKGGTGSEKGTAGGLLNPSTKEDNAGNVNVPGSKSATKLSAVSKGHGAEKKGAGEDAQNKKSIIGSR